MKKLLLFITLVLFIGWQAHAQQQAMYTQYMFNPLAINPAYAGSLDAVTASAISRTQWSGIEGAPETQTFSIHGPVKYSRASFGGQLIHDQITVSNSYGIYGSYSYYIPIGKMKLSFGLRAGASYYNADMTEVNVYYPEMNTTNDPVFNNASYGGWMPNFGVGLYLRGKKGYLGFAVPEVINNEIESSVDLIKAKQAQHIFFHGGYIFPLSPGLMLKPNFLVKSVKGAPLQVDLNANLLIKDILWVGASYRWDESFAGLIEIDFDKQWRIGYSYDIPGNNDLGPFHQGSHEFLLSYRLIRRNEETISPRYF